MLKPYEIVVVIYIPLIRRDGLCPLSNCLVTEICLENEKFFLTCLYRSCKMKSSSLLASTNHLVKINTSFKVFVQM